MAIRKLRRAMPYRPDQVFDLVMDVERYPRFVPWWEAARVYDRQPNVYHTEQVVRFKLFRQRFRSVTTFERPRWVFVRAEGGMIRRFDLSWHFHPDGSDGCEVELDFDLELSTSVLQKIAEAITEEAVHLMLTAFEREARRAFSSPGAVSPTHHAFALPPSSP